MASIGEQAPPQAIVVLSVEICDEDAAVHHRWTVSEAASNDSPPARTRPRREAARGR